MTNLITQWQKPALTIIDGSTPCICHLPGSQFPQNLKVITHGETVSHPHFGSAKKKERFHKTAFKN